MLNLLLIWGLRGIVSSIAPENKNKSSNNTK